MTGFSLTRRSAGSPGAGSAVVIGVVPLRAGIVLLIYRIAVQASRGTQSSSRTRVATAGLRFDHRGYAGHRRWRRDRRPGRRGRIAPHRTPRRRPRARASYRPSRCRHHPLREGHARPRSPRRSRRCRGAGCTGEAQRRPRLERPHLDKDALRPARGHGRRPPSRPSGRARRGGRRGAPRRGGHRRGGRTPTASRPEVPTARRSAGTSSSVPTG